MPRSHRNLLIVEDDPDIAWLYRLMFEKHDVTIAPDLETARDALLDPRSRPDLVLLDIGQPDGFGLDLCMQLKMTTPDVPVVVVSADRYAHLAAAASGADAFFAKPIEPDDVAETVDRLLPA